MVTVEGHEKLCRLVNACRQGADNTTPIPLVQEMIDKIPEEIWKDTSATILDPAAGTGTFLVAAYWKMIEAGDTHENIISNRLFACEINLVYLKIINDKLGLKNIYNKDFLQLDLDMKFDVIIGNPPYTEGNGKTNLFDKFTYMSNSLLGDKGMLCFVIPKAWYYSNSSTNKKYREYLQNNNLKVLKELPDDIFNATVKTTYFILDKQYDNSEGIYFTNNKSESQLLDNTGPIFSSVVLSSILAKIKPQPGQYAFKSLYKKVKTVGTNTNVVEVSNADGIRIGKSNIISPDNDTYRLTTGYMRNSFYHIDSIHIAEPGINIKSGYVQMVCNSKAEAENIHSVLQSKLAKFIFDSTRTSRSLDSSQLNYLPFLTDKVYTDEKLYKLYELTEEEIDLIESTVA